MHKPVTVAGIEFKSQTDYFRHCQAILHRDEIGTEIVGDDREFVEAILYGRPKKVAELNGRKVVRYWRLKHPTSYYSSVCFFAELDDGTFLDFSFKRLTDESADGSESHKGLDRAYLG